MKDEYENLDDIEQLDEGVPELDEGYSEAPDYVERPQETQPTAKKFGQEEFERTIGNKNYYKDKNKENQNNLEESRKKRDEAQKRQQETERKRKEALDEKKASGNDKDSKKAYKAAKKEDKAAKKELKQANRDYKDSKRNIRNNKLDNLKNKAYQITNPVEAAKARAKNFAKQKAKDAAHKVGDKAKEGAKKAAKKTGEIAKKGAQKAGQAIAKGTEALISKIVSFIATNPHIAIGIGVALLLAAVIFLVVIAIAGYEEESLGSGITSAKVNYNINGINSDTTVQIVKVNSTDGSLEVVNTIPFEKYVAGVALYEMGEDYSDEAMKAHIITVRTNLLTMTQTEDGLGIDTTNNVIKVKNDDINHVYWDYETDLYRGEDPNNPGTYIYSPEYIPISEDELPLKTALSKDDKKRYESVVSSVMGMYITDANGNVVSVNYDQTTIDNIKNQATTNIGTENGSYLSLLMQNYSNVSDVRKAEEVEMIYYGEVGEFSNWKQKTKLGAPWGEVKIGTTATIDKVGCLITSISMQIAYSGVDTSPIDNFNPGTFATALKSHGCLSSGGAINSYTCVDKVVPKFKYVGRVYLSGNKEARNQKIREYAEKGYFIVIEVRKHNGGQHWVSLDVQNSAYADWKEIYMWDPATTKTKISEKWSYKAGEFIFFKSVK